MNFLMLTVLFMTALMSSVWSVSSGNLKRPAGSKCKVFPAADIDDDWYLENGDAGFYYPYASKLEGTSGVDSLAVPSPPDKSLQLRNCWTLFTKILDRKVPLKLEAHFNRINVVKAGVNTDKVPSIGAVFQFDGDFTLVLTDNQTYALVYGCLFDRNAFWTLVVPVDSELSDENKEIALTYVKDVLKFGTKKKDLASDKDPVRFLGSTIKTCGAEGEDADGGPMGKLSKLPDPVSTVAKAKPKAG